MLILRSVLVRGGPSGPYLGRWQYLVGRVSDSRKKRCSHAHNAWLALCACAEFESSVVNSSGSKPRLLDFTFIGELRANCLPFSTLL